MAKRSPRERVFVEAIGKVEGRRKCFEAHCGCWLGIAKGKRASLWASMSKGTFEEFEQTLPEGG